MDGLIGLFGGTFDPPHIGHLILAEEGRFTLGLHKVLWLITAIPPHKLTQNVTPLESRLEMVRIAIEGNPDFVLSRAEIDRPGPHYTADTLDWLIDQHPRARFVYLMGSDSLGDLLEWHQPERIVQQCESIGVMKRPHISVDLPALERELPGIQSKVRFFNAPMVDISAHHIRTRVRQGYPYQYLVLPSIAAFIEHHELYQNSTD